MGCAHYDVIVSQSKTRHSAHETRANKQLKTVAKLGERLLGLWDCEERSGHMPQKKLNSVQG